jgi:flagellar protein FliO/FliZ
MGYLEQIFGTELSGVGRYVTAFVLVMALIALTAWLMRRFGDTRAAKAGGGRGRQQRLAVLDSAVVDARRRLVLIRRDNVEHLILIGGPTDVVVEPNIMRASPLAAPAPRPVARTSAFEPIETIDYETPLIPSEPAYEEPRAAPPPQAQTFRPAPEQRSAPRPAPAQRLDPQYADMAHRLEAALRKTATDGDGAARPQPRTTTPAMPRAIDRPAAAPQVRAPEPRQPAPAPAPAQKTAADVFGNLEDEMASLLRTGGKTPQ